MRADRLLATLLLLQTHGRMPAPEIARRLEVSTRTVARDVEALSAAGVPVYAERGRRGGVVLVPGFRTDVTGLTDAEMRALFVLGGAGTDERGLAPTLASAVRKLVAAVPADRRTGIEAARRRLLVEPWGWRRGVEEVPMLPALEAAVLADERVRLRYRSLRTPGAGVRTVDPYGLVAKGGTWYLVAAHRGVARLFRVGRVREVTPTGTPARRPDDRDLESVWADLRDEVERAPDAVTVRLRVAVATSEVLLRVTAAQLAGPPVEVAREADAVLLDLTFRAPGAARGVLLGFGDTVEVLDPPSVRAEMATVAAGVVALYGDGLERSPTPRASRPV